jgi:hypothetical protein
LLPVANVLTAAAPAVSAVAAGGALLLTAAGLGHLRRRHLLRAALGAQRLLPRRLWRPVAAALGGAELLVGASVLAVLLTAPSAAVPPLAAQACGYGGLAAYLAVLRRRRPGAPCGCFGTDGPVTWLVVARAGLLAGGAAGAALLGAQVAAMPAVARLPCLAGGVVVAMAGWLLPVLARPAGTG